MAFIKAGVRDISVNLTLENVGKSNKKLASIVGVNLVINILFIKVVVIGLSSFSGSHYGLNECVNLTVLIKIVP